jgi:hypothetical protein
MLRKLSLAAALLVLVLPAAARAQDGPPQGLRGFLLRANEPLAHEFPRTPSFVWQGVRRPGTYEFELSMSRTFDESQILFHQAGIAQPAVAVPLQLPWMTGRPYALWAHVRFVGKDGSTTAWSSPFGFDMRWRDRDVPTAQTAPLGLVRWTPVEGATAYEVLYTDPTPSTSFYTTTNVADQREYWTFHQSAVFGSSIHWRVRAVRYVDQEHPLPNGIPAVSYGPWSPVQTTVIPPAPLLSGPLAPVQTISDTVDDPGRPVRAHELMPGFAWQGSAAVGGLSVGSPLYRVYVATDESCVNTVFVGAVVGSPAYAPRIYGGPLTLPQNTKDLGTWQAGRYKLGGSEGNAFDVTGTKIVTNEDPTKPVGGGAAASTDGATLNGKPVAHTDLWDSGWPNGRYYWTVVPVATTVEVLDGDTGAATSQAIEYSDTAAPQDACESGRAMSFGKVSSPVVTESSTPYASGIEPNGRMTAAVRRAPRFHGTPLVAWEPATGAQTYQVQWSKSRYPWKTVGTPIETPATAVVLPITKPGRWYYRVRGVNPSLPSGAKTMTWSAPVELSISGDVFSVVSR